jgi:hypothetical protein
LLLPVPRSTELSSHNFNALVFHFAAFGEFNRQTHTQIESFDDIDHRSRQTTTPKRENDIEFRNKRQLPDLKDLDDSGVQEWLRENGFNDKVSGCLPRPLVNQSVFTSIIATLSFHPPTCRSKAFSTATQGLTWLH